MLLLILLEKVFHVSMPVSVCDYNMLRSTRKVILTCESWICLQLVETMAGHMPLRASADLLLRFEKHHFRR